jgi:hypothetical protein
VDTDTLATLPAAPQPATAATAASAAMEEEQAVVEEADTLVPVEEEEGAVVDLEVRAVFKVRTTPLSAFSAKTRHWIDGLAKGVRG